MSLDNPEGDPLKVTPIGLLRAAVDVTGVILQVATLPITVPAKFVLGIVADEIFEDDGRKMDRHSHKGDWGRHR